MTIATAFTGILFLLSQGTSARVELEIVMEGGGPIGSQQEWLKLLSEVGADNLRMRTSKRGDRPDVKKSESRTITSYKVIGVLTADNRLILPGGKYGRGDMAKLKTWLADVKAGSLEAKPAEEKMAFGLSSDELVFLHERLAAPVGSSTKDVAIPDVIRAIRKQTQIKISLDSSAKDALKTDMVVMEELKATSGGTALAAIIRPLGLVAVPVQDRSGETKITLIDARQAKEHWPIGWPAEKAPREVAPKLFEFLPVEIDDYKLDETLAAIEAKIEMPFIYDQNSLVLNDIELSETRVTFPAKRTYYYEVIRRVVGQTDPKMKMELRVDEAGKPFIWLTN